MRADLLLLATLLTLASPSVPAAGPPPADSVRVYRCVAADGTVALQDAPCDGGLRQQVRDLPRPQPPPRPAPAPSTPPQPQPIEREVRIVTVQPPQPLYECLAPDGERYTSDDGLGRPRWVPLWVTGHGPLPRHARASVSGHFGGGSGGIAVQGGTGPTRPLPALAGGTWVRDSCHPLPAQEACARLRDHRWTLVRRYHSALQSERQALTREQRGIEARLDRDCGGH
ncbi:DUF4124 domain-containing protein [Stenotrophomonas mori]|uniref:DUF4124 domain-containing protein n=1 Tax=Stenotrophomonas mori TaxID=2871096 RepID=A0ABT0SJC5_9GAMM|nr:DUF4124 domain-containing protein [Stenotrophomonas mori]MCL7715440.1 DUF4124 domain-containing protein [Stenotrophomonas mori]